MVVAGGRIDLLLYYLISELVVRKSFCYILNLKGAVFFNGVVYDSYSYSINSTFILHVSSSLTAVRHPVLVIEFS